MLKTEKNAVNNENSRNKINARYTAAEDLAIINYMITDNRYLQASGIQVWKDAEKLGICPNRPYLSMKERFRKVIVKNLKQYNVEKDIAIKITQFMRANQKGIIRETVDEEQDEEEEGMICLLEDIKTGTYSMMKTAAEDRVHWQLFSVVRGPAFGHSTSD